MSRSERWAIFRMQNGAYTVARDDDHRTIAWDRITGVATVNGGRSIVEVWNETATRAAEIRRER